MKKIPITNLEDMLDHVCIVLNHAANTGTSDINVLKAHLGVAIYPLIDYFKTIHPQATPYLTKTQKDLEAMLSKNNIQCGCRFHTQIETINLEPVDA